MAVTDAPSKPSATQEDGQGRRQVDTERLVVLPSGAIRCSGSIPGQAVKNIQVIDGALNAAYDIFQATDQEFSLIFPPGQDIGFIDEVMARGDRAELDRAFAEIWKRRIPKAQAMGIHGILFYELDHKKRYYPTRRDEEAINPNGTPLRLDSGSDG